jgi:glycosyltransferase involved in cell wall biosynthesis
VAGIYTVVEVALNRLNPHSPPAGPLALDDFGRDRCAISVVLPVFNEEGNLREVHRRLTAVLRALDRPYELIFVDDGSSDSSIDILTALHHEDPAVTVIKLSRNFGHHLAITAGMDHAEGDAVVLMDADLQDRPEEIPTLLRKLDEGYDVVYGIRHNSQHSFLKRLTSRSFFAVMGRMVHGFDLNTGIFRAARRHVIDTVRQCRETNRFVVGLISWAGFRQTGVIVEHAARGTGRTKYTLTKQLKLGINTLTSFTIIPLRLATYLGVLASLAAAAGAAIIIARRLLWGLGVVGWPSLMVAILFLGGVQLLCLGIFGEYLGRVLAEVQQRPLYVVSRRWSRTRSAA